VTPPPTGRSSVALLIQLDGAHPSVPVAMVRVGHVHVIVDEPLVSVLVAVRLPRSHQGGMRMVVMDVVRVLMHVRDR
jgi:hypothetical protein